MKNLLIWLIPISLAVLITCRSDESIPSDIARIEVVLAGNQPPRPVYILEDSIHNTITLEAYSFNESNFFIGTMANIQFLVNGRLLPGNTYKLRQPGQYTFTVRYGNRSSTKSLTLTLSRAADCVKGFFLLSPVAYLNADSVSALPLQFKLFTTAGDSIPLNDSEVIVQVDGRSSGALKTFSTGQPGKHTIQGRLFGLTTNQITVTARMPVVYPVRRIPVVIHVPANTDAILVDPNVVLSAVNQIYRKQIPANDPNQADAYIEFVPARVGPDGQQLAVPGLNRLLFNNPAQADSALLAVTNVLHNWCPLQYINVFIGIDWLRTYPAGFSYSYVPQGTNVPAGISCEELKFVTWTANQFPAVYLDRMLITSVTSSVGYNNISGVLSHELGHFFGLGHTFSGSCRGNGVTDTPRHDQTFPDKDGYKFTCDNVRFVSDYVMDYYCPFRSFTYDQVTVMQRLKTSLYIPATTSTANPQRRDKLNQQQLLLYIHAGRTEACPILY